MDQSAHFPYAKERRYRRFNLHFPVCLSYPSGGVLHELDAISDNVSVGGVLVTAGVELPLHTPVRLTMNVVGPSFRRPIRLSGEGEVVRVESSGPHGAFAIAVECRCPIREFEGGVSV